MPVYQRLLVRAGSECRRDAANAFGAVGEAAFGAISFFREREDIALELDYIVSRNDAEAEKDKADRQAIIAGL
ncbi:hypothetical protein, partial [Mesorhizobium sp. LNJC372A00]|uniref:hypothetical protein n=2 Tax=unclassified Mesorhizobium TaxID=325217 RepID=UPI0012EC3BB7